MAHVCGYRLSVHTQPVYGQKEEGYYARVHKEWAEEPSFGPDFLCKSIPSALAWCEEEIAFRLLEDAVGLKKKLEEILEWMDPTEYCVHKYQNCDPVRYNPADSDQVRLAEQCLRLQKEIQTLKGVHK